MSEADESYNNIKRSIETVIGVPVSDIRKKATQEDIFSKKFITLIQTIETLRNRDMDLNIKFNVNFDDYNIPFYEAIDSLMELSFPDEYVRHVIYFYLYERVNDLGEIIPIEVFGREFKIQSPLQLLGVIKFIESQYAG